MLRNVVILIACGLSMVVLTSCSGKEKEETAEIKPGAIDPNTGIAAAQFDWQHLSSPLVDFYYQPDDSVAAKAERILGSIDDVYQTTAYVLGLDSLPNVEFYCYKDEGTFKAHTHRDAPFYIGDKMYYGYGPTYGRMFTIYIMQHLPGDTTQFHFFAEGLPTLYDWSGRNYHQAASRFLEEGNLSPVADLVDNEAYDSLGALKRQVEAASFIGFMTYEFGGKPVMAIYHSSATFAKAAQDNLGVGVDELHRRWEVFLPEHTTEKELERQGQ